MEDFTGEDVEDHEFSPEDEEEMEENFFELE